jgi:hypothetical protein
MKYEIAGQNVYPMLYVTSARTSITQKCQDIDNLNSHLCQDIDNPLQL